MFPVIRIGPAAVQTASLLIILGVYLGLQFSEYFTRKRGENPDSYTNLTLIAGLTGLVVSRASFVVANIDFFRNNLSSLVSVDSSLLDPWGGVAGALIASLIYSQRKKLKFWIILDRLTPLLAVTLVFLGLAHISSGHAFGAPASLPWAIRLWGAQRHPSQFYETISATAVLLYLWKQFTLDDIPGLLFLKFTALTTGYIVILSAFSRR